MFDRKPQAGSFICSFGWYQGKPEDSIETHYYKVSKQGDRNMVPTI